jgi:hypothetical protein
LVDVRFETAPATASSAWHPVVLAYRQAGMFVTYLHDSDGPAFARMMNDILDGRSFIEAVTVSYHEDIQSLWKRFAQISAERK